MADKIPEPKNDRFTDSGFVPGRAAPIKPIKTKKSSKKPKNKR